MLSSALIAALLAAGPPAVVDRVLAVVDDQPVLLSEVRAAERVRGEDEARALETVIDEMLMFAEAARLSQAALTAAEEESALQSLRAGHADDPDPDALRRMARRQATILKYVDFRFRPQVRITPEDVLGALRAAAEETSPPASVEDAEARAVRDAGVRRALEAEDLDRRIEAWVADLRRAARVRYNARGR